MTGFYNWDAKPTRWPLFSALGATVLAWPIYLACLDLPFIRATAFPLFLLTGIAAFASFLYIRFDPSPLYRFLGTLNVFGVLAAAGWFFWLSSIPQPESIALDAQKAPDFQLKNQEGRSVRLRSLTRQGPVLVVFYRGSWCPFCVSELRGLQSIEEALRREGVRIAAISVDTPAAVRSMALRMEIGFEVLSDETGETVKEYGVLHPEGGPRGSDTAIPAHFLVDSDGAILWRRVASRVQDRASPDEVLDAVRAITSAAG